MHIALLPLRRLAHRAVGKVKRYRLARKWSTPPALAIDPSRLYHASLRTTKGTIEVDLLADVAPRAVNNFVYLARGGYYDGSPFHRVVRQFVIQGGDPTGTGYGGPGYTFPDELVTQDYERGTVAMANAGPNTNGSQFFIVLPERGIALAKVFTIFGRVTGGWDVLDAIERTPTAAGLKGGEPSLPLKPILLHKVVISETPRQTSAFDETRG